MLLRAGGIVTGALALGAAVAGCLPASSYTCTNDDQCAPLSAAARCENSGYCSVQDSSCESDWRYVRSAGSFAGQCVTPDNSGVADGAPLAVDSQPLDDAGAGRAMRAVGGSHHAFCAASETGYVWCWGEALYAPNAAFPVRPSPVLVVAGDGSPLTGAVDVGVGEYHGCALLDGGRVACWGANYHGQLGTGGVERLHAQVISSINDASAIFVAGGHTCALRSDTSLWCWGRNATAELGDGTLEPRSTPRKFGTLTGVVAGGIARYTTCAITSGAELRCAGRNNLAQLGVGTTGDPIKNPVKVVTDASNTALAGVTMQIGNHDHNCALAAGVIHCWGDDDAGELGQASPTTLLYPAPLDHGNAADCQVVELGSGGQSGCARCASGRVACWGNGDKGYLGNGSTESSLTLQYVPELDGATDLASTTGSTCVVNDARVLCWGQDTYGELGDGVPWGSSEYSATPVQIVFP